MTSDDRTTPDDGDLERAPDAPDADAPVDDAVEDDLDHEHFEAAIAAATVDPEPADDGLVAAAKALRDRDAHRPGGRERRRRPILITAIAIVAVAAIAATVAWFVFRPNDGGTVAEPTTTPTASAVQTPSGPPTTAPPTETATPTPTASTPSDNAAIAGDITSPSSNTVLVNKLTPLQPADYVPDDLVLVSELGIPSMNDHALRSETATAIQTMFAAAAEMGYELDMTSGYRSYDSQTSLYTGYVDSLGQAGADATSARPGYSEHQTGLTADISAPAAGCPLEQCFAETDEGRWLAANAYQYGFILRYPNGMTHITGYEFEPWHFRYVGTAVSTAMHEQGIATYEEFLGAPAAPDYAA